MRKDIEAPPVNDVRVGIVKQKNEENEYVWNVYLINEQDMTLENVLVSSLGYKIDKKTGDKQSSSELRHSLGDVKAKSFAKIEPIIEDVFQLNNEYFVTFFSAKGMHEKAFIFLQDSILEKNFINVPFVNEQGVMI